jgi:hypothetical protein
MRLQIRPTIDPIVTRTSLFSSDFLLERLLDTQEVRGSSPLSPIQALKGLAANLEYPPVASAEHVVQKTGADSRPEPFWREQTRCYYVQIGK